MDSMRAGLRCPGSSSSGAVLLARRALIMHSALLSAPASAGGPALRRLFGAAWQPVHGQGVASVHSCPAGGAAPAGKSQRVHGCR